MLFMYIKYVFIYFIYSDLKRGYKNGQYDSFVSDYLSIFFVGFVNLQGRFCTLWGTDFLQMQF